MTQDSKKNTWLHVHELFNRYFGGTANEKEREIVETWKAPDKEEKNLYSTSKMMEEDKNLVYKKLEERFGFERPVSVRNRRMSFIGQFMKYAAAVVFIVSLAGGLLYFVPRLNTSSDMVIAESLKTYFQTTNDEPITQITLSDGSTIQLNKGTKIYIAENQYNRHLREVWLDEGEAFFEVAKNPEKPFIVHHRELQTTVRGTSFNIKAYKELGEISVSVKTGKVEVGSSEKLFATLTTNEQLHYGLDEKSMQIANVKWNDACGWMDGRLVLNKANIDELRLRIKQTFGKEMIVEVSTLNDMLLTSSFEQGTALEHVMDIISAMYDLKYRITDSKVILYN